MNSLLKNFYDLENSVSDKIRLGQIDSAIKDYDNLFYPSFKSLRQKKFEFDYKSRLICFTYALGYSLCPKNCSQLKELSLKNLNDMYDSDDIYDLYESGKNTLLEFYEFFSNRPCCSNTLITEVINHIEKNIDTNLSLESISENFHISRNYLSSLFLKATNVRLIDFITSSRLRKSKILLKSSDLSMLEISHKCGFKTQNYFSTVFKKNEGMNPSTYRNMYRTIK